MHRPVYVAHSSFIEDLHMTKNLASLETTLKVTYMDAHHLGRLQLYSKIEDQPKKTF
jgi:hypothetical protein